MTEMSNELSEQQLQLVAGAMDAVADAYAENNKVIFANESERAKAHFGPVNRALKMWSKSRKCMVPDCNSRSIARSHTVPKGMSLSEIAENGHLVTPFFNHKAGAIRVESIGISDATTFPGFCLTHERLFHEFENMKSIETEPHIFLQTYRAACRELFRTKFLIEQHDWKMAEYLKSRNTGLIRLLDEQLKGANLGNFDIKSFSISEDPLVDLADEYISSVITLKDHLENSLLPALQNAVFQKDTSGLSIDATSLDLEIPVALSGSAPFFINDKGKEKKVFLLITAIPMAGSTLLILGGLASHASYLAVYKTRWFTHALSILSMVESWMINGTDQWYLKPSVWNAIPADRQSRLLSLLFSCNNNIGDDCDLSVFDQIRKSVIELSDAANAGNQNAGYISYIKSQRNKMT